MHIPVNPFFVLIPFIGGLYYLKKQSNENIDFLKQFLILMLIIMFSYFLAISVWDVSWDGRGSHIATIILYKNGWLPVYQNYEDFALNCHVYPASAFWGNCYMNFIEIISANIYKLTNFVESTKTTNFVLLFSIFLYSSYIFRKFFQNKKILPLLMSVILILNPVCVCQWFTNDIDLHIYFAFALLMLTVLKIEYQKNTSKADIFMFVCSSLMLTMTKFTGCMYLFVICSIYLIYLILLKRNIKRYIKTVLIIGSLIVLTGISPLYTNYRDYGHPFYPIFGQNKINIIDESIPYGFQNMSYFERFFRSNFSETVHSRNNATDNPETMRIPVKLKIPFTINIKSFYNLFHWPDITVGGFGYLWSGILLLSLLYLSFIRFRNKSEKYLFWLIIMMVITTTFINPECWWARYVPQFWLFPLLIMFFGLLQENFKNNLFKILKLSLLYFIMCSFVINSLIIVFQNTQFNIQSTTSSNYVYEYIDLVKKPKDKIYLMIRPAWENMVIADETIIPHFEESYGKENIIYVPYDEKKIKSEEFLQIQQDNIIHFPCYFFKIGK